MKSHICKSLIFTALFVVLFFSCQRELKDDPTLTEIDIWVNSDLEKFTNAGYAGFVNTPYDLALTITSKYKTGQYPVNMTYESNRNITIGSGASKFYEASDTVSFALQKGRTLKVTAHEPGNYRLMLHFKDLNNQTIGSKELNFNITESDLGLFLVRDGNRALSLDEMPNFLEDEGSFIVRVHSEREELNKGKLTLTTNIIGSSVQVKNWKENEAKISQSDDLPQTVDFLVEYSNIQIGASEFVFTAQTQNSKSTLQTGMTVRENKPGTLTFNTTYDPELDYYTCPQLWVGQTDSVDYVIQKDPESGMNSFRIMFEMKDPTKLWFFSTGDESLQNASTNYEANKWHDFSDKMTGRLYYVFPSPQTYQDTVYISLQNGTQGPNAKYKLFLSCKQSDDFDFSVSIKPTLVDGYDEIKLSELRKGIDDLVALKVVDENPYAKFDYRLGAEGMKGMQTNIKQSFTKEGYSMPTNLPYGEWLAGEFGNLTSAKDFKILCEVLPNDANADGYIGMFNWTYDVERKSDKKRKSVTRQIKIIDDRLSFLIDMAPGNSRESMYQNEIITAYQIKYHSPSLSADDYLLTVTSSNDDVADVYFMNKDLTFRKATFGAAETPPASHSQGGSMLAVPEIGKMQIKGKQPGAAVLHFTLTHKASGASATIDKTVTTISDPVQFVIEPAPTLDAMSKERPAIPFGGQYHTYQNPRFKIRLNKASGYSANTSGVASVVFSTTPSLTNVAKLTVRGGTVGTPGYHWATNAVSGAVIELAYDTDYFVTVGSPTSHPWNIPIGSEQFLNIKMTKATNQQTQIVAEYNDMVKYSLRAYNKPIYGITAEAYNESGCTIHNVENISFPVYVSFANVIISSDYGHVTRTDCSGTYDIRNAALSSAIWNDGNELNGFPYIFGSSNYNKQTVVGDKIEAIPGHTPPDPYWKNYGPGASVTTYGSIKTTVRDNWNCSVETYVEIPPKIVYGTN